MSFRTNYYEHMPYEPIDEIRRGDVILWNGGMRTVRRVTYTHTDHLYCTQFAKLKRSGYRSPATIYHRAEVRAAFGGIVAHRKDPTLCATDLECRVQKEIDRDWRRDDKRYATEAESVGVIW